MASSSRPALSTIQDYFSANVPGVLEVDGSPPVQVVVEPSAHRIGLRTPSTGQEWDLSLPEYRNLEGSSVRVTGTEWRQLMVTALADVEESYAFVCAVIDRLQTPGATLDDALKGAVGAFEELLALRRGLTVERQVGLLGELLTLAGLVNSIGGPHAVAAWRGAELEEHDFGLTGADVEVKSTTSERRSHWISSVSQLLATADRPLYLLSTQFTRAGVGAGVSLPAMVKAVRNEVGASEALDAKLTEAGYRDTDADLYRGRWTTRTEPAFYLVDSNFPAVTPARVLDAVPSAHRIVDLRYRIDLAGLEPTAGPFLIPDIEQWKEAP